MMGKLLGIAAVGLTMVGTWLVALVTILTWKAGAATAVAGQVLTVLHSSSLIPMFAVYFLFGYLIYATSILALGSVCNTLKEAQSYMGIITMLMMVPLMTLTFIPKDPNGTVARVLSWIPLYTPFIMMNRIMADPPWIDLLGTLALLVVTAATALWLAGKVFRIGILRTGQPPKLLELVRWLRRKN
jgi:ABC-type Na+ efflux pump permease subunit